MIYLEKEVLIDTYGGDFTYRDTYYELEEEIYYVTTDTYGVFRGDPTNETKTDSYSPANFEEFLTTL